MEKAEHQDHELEGKFLKQIQALVQKEVHRFYLHAQSVETDHAARKKLAKEHKAKEKDLAESFKDAIRRFDADNKALEKELHDGNKDAIKKEGKEYEDRDKAQYEKEKAERKAKKKEHEHDERSVVVGRDVAIDQATMDEVQGWLDDIVGNMSFD